MTTIKDSGKRQEFSTGMVRDVSEDKVDYTLALDGPMFERLARHLTEGAKKYDKRNWMKAQTEEELERFRESAVRHFFQWLRGEIDEDHFAATIFNMNGTEYVKERLRFVPNRSPSITLPPQPEREVHWENDTEGAHYAGQMCRPGCCEDCEKYLETKANRELFEGGKPL